jgi:hypothetical protein
MFADLGPSQFHIWVSRVMLGDPSSIAAGAHRLGAGTVGPCNGDGEKKKPALCSGEQRAGLP